MIRIIRLENKLVRPALNSWIILDKGETKCHWPLRGLEFKLKNLVAPPLAVNIDEKKYWKLMRCEILLNGTKSFLKFCKHWNVTFTLFYRTFYNIPCSKHGSITRR